MNTKNWTLSTIILVEAIALMASGCTTGQGNGLASTLAPADTPTPLPPTRALINSATPLPPTIAPTGTLIPTILSQPLSQMTLRPGDLYFSLDGKPTFLLSRNITGKTSEDFATLLDYAHQGGTKVIRLHLTHGWWGDPWINTDWSNDEKWARDWDSFFDQARADGIFVIPVFGVWADWNNGMPADVTPLWQYNPLNVANGGPLTAPTGLFQSGSDTQKHWMAWVKTLVERWQGRNNIAAWEIFSEINLASGAPGETDAKGAVSETAAVDFTDKAAAIIRSADANHRPVTLSLAVGAPFTNEWARFYDLNTLDFIEIHPYSDTLDRELVSDVPKNLRRYNKPVMIGESGLWSMATNVNASIGIGHAIWAGLVSGAMNGRALWANDGYSIYSTSDRALAFQFMQAYATTELPVARFVSGIDFSGYKPLSSTSTAGVWGAAIGNDRSVIGWFRDAASEPPDWNLKRILSKQTVTISISGSTSHWKVDFYKTKTGTDIISSASMTSQENNVIVPLPDFNDDIAFKMTSQLSTTSTTVP